MRKVGVYSLILFLSLIAGSTQVMAQEEAEACSPHAVSCDNDGDGSPDECCLAGDVEAVTSSDGNSYLSMTAEARDKNACRGKNVPTDVSDDGVSNPDSCCKPQGRNGCHGQTTSAFDYLNFISVCCTRQKI